MDTCVFVNVYCIRNILLQFKKSQKLNYSYLSSNQVSEHALDSHVINWFLIRLELSRFCYLKKKKKKQKP